MLSSGPWIAVVALTTFAKVARAATLSAGTDHSCWIKDTVSWCDFISSQSDGRLKKYPNDLRKDVSCEVAVFLLPPVEKRSSLFVRDGFLYVFIGIVLLASKIFKTSSPRGVTATPG